MSIVTPQCQAVEDFCLNGFNGALPTYVAERRRKPSAKPIRIVVQAPASLHIKACLRCMQLLQATTESDLPPEMARSVEFHFLGKIYKYALMGALYDEIPFRRRFAAAVVEATSVQPASGLLAISFPSSNTSAARALCDEDDCDEFFDGLMANTQALTRPPTAQELAWARSIAAEADIISASTTFTCEITQRNFGAMRLAATEQLPIFVTALNAFLRPVERAVTDTLIRQAGARQEEHLRSCTGCSVAKLTEGNPQLAKSNILICSED